MEFTVSRADLVRELNLSQGVVEKKTTIPILSNVLMEAEGDRVHLTATDLELGIRCSCPARVKKPGSGTVPARRLLDYVRLLPDADVQMKIQENHWASLTCGRSKTRIAGMSRDSFPELPQMPAVLAEIPFGVLTAMISKTVFAISTEESRFTLNGALLVLRKGGIVMVATDGHRLAMVESSGELPGVTSAFRALLPRKAMLELQKLASDSDPAAIVQFSGAREMAQGIDVRADVTAERQGFRRRAAARGRDELAVLLHQTEQVGRMHGMVRHADEIWLREIVDFGGLEEIEELGSHDHRGYRRARAATRRGACITGQATGPAGMPFLP